MSGGGGKPRKRSEIDTLLYEMVHHHGIGQGRKRRRSQYPKNPSFTTSYTPKSGIDKRSGQSRQGGGFTIPSHIRNQFPPFQVGDSFKVEITNLQNQIPFKDVFKPDNRGRLSITQRQGHYMKYQKGASINVRLQKHFSMNNQGIKEPITTLARFTYNSKWGAVIWISLPLPAKELLGLDVYQKGREVHWDALGYQGTGTQYQRTQIGISPTKLGLKPENNSFVSQFTILNPNLTPHEALKINNVSRARFYNESLLPMQKLIDVRFTGKHQVDKPNMQKWWVKDMVKNKIGPFSKFVQVQEEKQIQLQDGRIVQPDMTLIDENGNKTNLENKAIADGMPLSIEKNLPQALKYKETGEPLYYMTTAEKRYIAKELQKVPDKLITREDLDKIIEETGNPIYREISYHIRMPWP